jgi:hypothetical protein
MRAHAFVDESKYRHGYLLAAAIIKSCDVARVRKHVGALRLPGQRRVHFTAESDARRKTILNVMTVSAGPAVTIYDASAHRDPRAARDAAMTALVDDLAKMGAELLVIEQDDQAVASDRRIIRERAERAGCQDVLRYQHQRASGEALLAIPDAVAWSWAKGPQWRKQADGLVAHVAEV